MSKQACEGKHAIECEVNDRAGRVAGFARMGVHAGTSGMSRTRKYIVIE